MPPKVEKIFKFCQKYDGIFTGSRAMKLENKNSDWDFVVVVDNHMFNKFPHKIINRFGGTIKPYDEYGDSLYGIRIIIEIWCERKWWGLFNAPPKVNVIIDNKKYTSIDCWIQATEFCKKNPDEAREKIDRIDIFEKIGVIQGD